MTEAGLQERRVEKIPECGERVQEILHTLPDQFLVGFLQDGLNSIDRVLFVHRFRDQRYCLSFTLGVSLSCFSSALGCQYRRLLLALRPGDSGLLLAFGSRDRGLPV